MGSDNFRFDHTSIIYDTGRIEIVGRKLLINGKPQKGRYKIYDDRVDHLRFGTLKSYYYCYDTMKLSYICAFEYYYYVFNFYKIRLQHSSYYEEDRRLQKTFGSY